MSLLFHYNLLHSWQRKNKNLQYNYDFSSFFSFTNYKVSMLKEMCSSKHYDNEPTGFNLIDIWRQRFFFSFLCDLSKKIERTLKEHQLYFNSFKWMTLLLLCCFVFINNWEHVTITKNVNADIIIVVGSSEKHTQEMNFFLHQRRFRWCSFYFTSSPFMLKIWLCFLQIIICYNLNSIL